MWWLIPAAWFLVRLARVLPVLERVNRQGRRPIACNVCMAFWAGLAAWGLRWVAGDDPVQILGVAGLVLAGLELAELLRPGAPPPFPP